MKTGLTEIICIIDKSGSMHDRVGDVIGGFNEFLADQKALPGEARLSVTLFDTAIVRTIEGRHVQGVMPWTKADYRPGGRTALLDAVGVTIDAAEGRFAAAPEEDRQERTVVCIITDGRENSSREYSRKAILDRVSHFRDAHGWEFVFLGADAGSFREARGMGIEAAYGFAKDPAGIKSAYKGMSRAVERTRRGMKAEDYDGQDLLWRDSPAPEGDR